MNKCTLLSLCSFIISTAYSMQPQQPVASLTFAQRKERARTAYRACARRLHLKYAECYNEKTETVKTENGQCEWTKHIECWKIAQEKFTEGFYEEIKEYFKPGK